ncbi:MAG: Pycsar system effector family protein [Isosphaeraceae bacterium]
MDERESIATEGLEEKDKREFLWRIQDANQSAIRFADTKAGAIFGFALATTGWTFGALIQAGSYLPDGPARWGLLVGVVIMSVSLLLTLVNTLLVILPRRGPLFDGRPIRTGGSMHEIPPGDSGPIRGLLYFEDIARSSIGSYREALHVVGPEPLSEQLARDVWRLSRICQRKYDRVRWSLWCMTSTTIFSLLVLLLLGLGKLDSHSGSPQSSSIQVAASIPQQSLSRSARPDFPGTVR